MRIVVTRPERDARRWAHELRARGHEPLLLPLIEIAPAHAAAQAGIAAAWQALASYQAVMFVSRNAVEAFMAAAPGRWPGVRAWAPGPGTAEALHAHGVPAGLVDGPLASAAQFDSHELWARVAPQVSAASRILFVRGGDAQGRAQGRDWLAQQVAAAGGAPDEIVAYARRLPAWGEGERAAAAAAAGDGSIWLFSSSEAVAALAALLPGQDWSRARAIATHPRIAQAARDAGFGRVREARPDLHEILASIESDA